VAFAPYSEYWREMRKLFVVEFLSARRVEASRYAREAEVEKLIGRLSRAAGTPVFLEDHIFALMDGVIGTVAFGNIYGTEQFAHRKHFHDVLDEAMSAKAGFSAEDYYPNAIGRLVDRLTGAAARRERVFRDLDAFFDVIIDQHLDPSRAAPEKGPDLIDAFVALMRERRHRQQGVGFTRDNIKGLLSVRLSSCSFTLAT
jgi:4-hydroxyphenylacetaldehyde oxime monooxygenase